MLKYVFILVFGFNLLPIAIAQTPSYWQQDVDYEIHVALDDVNHIVTGDITIKYTNNSPDTLRQIWMRVAECIYEHRNCFGKRICKNK